MLIWVGKIVGPRLREPSSASRGNQKAESRNLGPAFLRSPVRILFA